MTKTLFIGERSKLEEKAGKYLAEKVEQNPLVRLGGATGRSPKKVYEIALNSGVDFSDASIHFLDEYFGFIGVSENGEHTSYKGYAVYNLHTKPRSNKVSEDRVFRTENIYTPRGNFYEKDQLVISKRLDEILSENPIDFEFRGMSFSETDMHNLTELYGIKTPLQFKRNRNGNLVRTFVPEIFIKPDAKNPVLGEILKSNRAYEKRVTKSKIALQVLGIGVEAHIAFNEEGTSPDSETHLTALAFSTLKANEDDYTGDASWYAITQGIKTVMNAEELMLLAFGKTKINAVYDMLFQEPGPKYPATYVQRHENVLLYIDNEALAKCEEVCKDKGLKLEQGLENKGWNLRL